MKPIALSLCAALLGGPAFAQELVGTFGPEDAARTLVVRSTTDLSVLGPVVEQFADSEPDLHIRYEQWLSNDLYALTASDCADSRHGADLVLSSAVHQMVKLVNDGCASPYRSALTRALPPELRWRDELWGVTREPAVIVYNRALVPQDEVPLSRFDLLDLLRPQDSRYTGRLATYDIERSGLGYLLAFADSLEATTFGGLMESFGRSGAVATCCSAEIIDAVISGEYLAAYNVLGSYALSRAEESDKLGVVAPSDYTLMLSRAAMIPDHAESGAAAEFLDFLLSEEGRQALREALLIVSLDDPPPQLLNDADDDAPRSRPIEFSPALLVALDRHRRMLFERRWRDSFPAEGGGG